MSFLKKGLDVAKGGVNKVTGKTEIEKLESTNEELKSELDSLKKEHGVTKDALEKCQLDLQRERAARIEVEHNFESYKQEIEDKENAALEEEQSKRQEEARAAMEASQLEEAAKEKALHDAALAKEAMSGLMTNDEKLGEALCTSSEKQLDILKQTYISNYGRDLYKMVKKHTGGNFRSFCLALLEGALDYQCNSLKDSLSGLTTNEQVVVDILCPKTADELTAIKNRYQELFNKDLVEHVEKNTSGSLRKYLVSLLQCTRATGEAKESEVNMDAENLFNAGQGRLVGTDDQVFITVISQRSREHLIALNAAYRNINKKEYTLLDVLHKQFGGNLQRALTSTLFYIINPSSFYATYINEAMKGIGCDDLATMHVILIRREVDWADIVAAYAQQGHDRPLNERVQDELGGNLGKAVSLLLSKA
eukprot:GCRY01000562.1.p1 GENE.GCRY01000562.1~~GCRY01000562.1.p1  ORF type:complete len:457 (+),score=110.35 GCRY01000562.1:107-1372(+)